MTGELINLVNTHAQGKGWEGQMLVVLIFMLTVLLRASYRRQQFHPSCNTKKAYSRSVHSAYHGPARCCKILAHTTSMLLVQVYVFEAPDGDKTCGRGR
jgi:hypothetical protein